MKILQVHNRHRIPGGEDVVVDEERELLEHAGHTVRSFLVENPETTLAAMKGMAQAPWNRAAARAVARAAQAFQPDVVHVHNTWFSLSPAVYGALAQAGFPAVVTLHNFRTVCINGLLMRHERPCDLCVGSHPGHGIVHRCYRDSVVLSTLAAATVVVPRWRNTWQRQVAQFLVLDEKSVPDLVSGGIPADRITVRRNSVSDPGPRTLPPSLGRQVIYAGRLDAEKGIDTLIDAWLRAQPVGLQLMVFGEGPLRPSLEAKAGDGVTFVGQTDRQTLRARMLEARALVFPSRCREAGPLAPIEAAGAGLPIVVSSLVSSASQIEAAEAGWTVAPNDVDGLAAALGRLGPTPALDEVGRSARRMYESHYGPEAAIASLEAVYQQAALQGGDNRVNVTGTDDSPA